MSRVADQVMREGRLREVGESYLRACWGTASANRTAEREILPRLIDLQLQQGTLQRLRFHRFLQPKYSLHLGKLVHAALLRLLLCSNVTAQPWGKLSEYAVCHCVTRSSTCIVQCPSA